MNLTTQETARITALQAKPDAQKSDAEKQELANLVAKQKQ